MATPKKRKNTTTKPTSDHQKWQIILNGLLQMLRSQLSQIDSLLEDRDTLESHLKIIHDRWVSDVRLFDNQIATLEMQIWLSEMSKSVEKAKGELVLGSKKKELLISLRKLENLENELDDFKAWFDILSHRCPNQQDISPDEMFEKLKAKGGEVGSSDGSSMHRCKALEKEVATLKREYKKLSVEKSSSESTLKTEISFVWNQYKDMESNYINQLQTKSNEVHEAKEEVKKLMADINEFRSSMAEKDDAVQTLKVSITQLEGEVYQKDAEITRLTKELESLKSPGPEKPVLDHCWSKPSSSRLVVRCDSVETLKAKISKLKCKASKKDREIVRQTKELESVKSLGTIGLPILKPCSSNPSPSGMTTRRNSMKGVSVVPVEEASSKKKQNDRVTKNRARSTDLKAESNKKNEKNSTVSTELQLSRSKNDAGMPKRKHCELSSSSRGRETKRNKRSLASPVEPAEEQVPRRSSGRRVGVGTIDTTPKLFTSQFKVPKIKTPSPL